MNAPIWIPCEGSDTPALHHLCTMCGKPDLIYRGRIISHQRLDILTMINRGDFGE